MMGWVLVYGPVIGVRGIGGRGFRSRCGGSGPGGEP